MWHPPKNFYSVVCPDYTSFFHLCQVVMDIYSFFDSFIYISLSVRFRLMHLHKKCCISVSSQTSGIPQRRRTACPLQIHCTRDSLSGKERPDTAHSGVQYPPAAFHRSPGHVRRDDAIGRLQQRIVRGNWFPADHVNGSSPDFSVPQCFRQCGFLHQTAPRRVKEYRPILHLPYGLPINDTLCFREQWTMERDNV